MNSIPPVIGLTGPIGAGKSTFANALVDELHQRNIPAHILPFANPVKEFAHQLGWNGEKDAKGRRLLQLLGTDCGRDCIGEDIWVQKWRASCGHFTTGSVVIADDVRFPNEALAVRVMCGTVVRISRPGLGYTWATGHLHASERQRISYDSHLAIPEGMDSIHTAAQEFVSTLLEPSKSLAEVDPARDRPFAEALRKLLNRYGIDAAHNTSDRRLAKYVIACLDAIELFGEEFATSEEALEDVTTAPRDAPPNKE